MVMSWRVVMVHCDLSDLPTMYIDLGAAQRRLRAARRDRRAVEIARQHGGDLGGGLQFDERGVEAFGFEETLVQRDIGRHVETVAADHLADSDFGLRIGAHGRG